MRKQQTGIVYTNDNCIGCNRCIMSCPVPGANKSVSKDGKNIIVVDPEKCIHCGNCLNECRHNAREYLDDTAEFLKDLGKKKISLLLAPSFFLLYPDNYGKIINYLISKGATVAYDASIGTDIAVYCYLKYLDEHPEGGVILQNCPAIVNFLERFSKDLFAKLIPVQSAAVCSAIYIHKYLKNTDEIAFLSPCIAKKDEFDSPETFGEISYNVTFRHLMDALSKEDLSSYPDTFENRCNTYGVLSATEKGIKKCFTNYVDDDKFVLAADNAVYHLPYYEYYEKTVFSGENIPYATDITTCDHGCIGGPGTEIIKPNQAEIAHNYIKLKSKAVSGNPELYSKAASVEEKKAALYERFKDVDPADFKRSYTEKFIHKQLVPASVIDEIFTNMYKTTPDERCVDCGSCGYSSCRELAEAIALGYNRKENCVYYEKEENRRLYLTDIMTGIPNTSYFNSRLTEIIRNDEGGQFAVVAFSLLGWELLNERFTYAEGDKTIIEFSKKAVALTDSDELIAHHGGVDFLAVIKKKKLNRFLEAIQAITVHPNDGLHEVEYPITISAGIYMMHDYERVAETVVGRTNIAAGRAKDGGAQIIFYDKSMKEQLLESIQLIKAFPEAIDREEFLVYYQPKINTMTSEMEGAEALVRWKTKRDIISPARFIPLFEKNGLICQLDFYVLNQVCRDLRTWMDKGLSPVTISVNFSKLHFKNADLADEIEKEVDKYGIPHDLVEIEITESAYEETKENLKTVLKALKLKGFSTSIDDFGSGYSSLNLLSQLDFQVLKLDKAFLETGTEDQKVKKVVDSVITMAKKLDMRVVAEGVERKEELEMLKGLSCDLIQGYYFDRPIPVRDFERRLEIPDYYQV